MGVKGSEGRHNRKRFYVASIISAVVFLTLIVFVAGLLFQDRQQDDGQKDLGGRSASKFLGGAVGLQFRVEAFNLTNSTRFTLADLNFASPSFGTIFASLPPRIVQVGLKFLF